jgi:hypothetical protein
MKGRDNKRKEGEGRGEEGERREGREGKGGKRKGKGQGATAPQIWNSVLVPAVRPCNTT